MMNHALVPMYLCNFFQHLGDFAETAAKYSPMYKCSHSVCS